MQNNPEINREDINRFLCSNCGANMVYDARLGKLACPYCGFAQDVVADGTVDERSYEEYLQRGTQNLQPMAQNAMQVSCTSCGAIVNFTPPETATWCDFCGAKIVAQPKAADPLIAPEGVLPFCVTENQTNANYKTWLTSLWFAPNKLKKFAEAGRMSSVYIPYWTYDADTASGYDGKRGDYYYVKTKNGSRRETRWMDTAGYVTRHFDDVCVPATKSLPAKYLERLEPWDLHEIKSYEPAFLSGHKAQTYQVALDEGFERFKQVADSVIRQDIKRDIGGDEQRIDAVRTSYSNITFKHLLLPIYAGAYKFNGKTYQLVVNGRTGEVQGERPYSWIKITLFVLTILIVILILVAIFGGKR